MSDRIPTFFLLVPGPWSSSDEMMAMLQPIGVPVVPLGQPLEAEAVGVEVVTDPDGFGDAVSYMPGFISEADIAACGKTTTAVVLEVAGTVEERREVIGTICGILHTNGGLAVRFEASGKAHSLGDCVQALAGGEMDDLLQLALVYSFDGIQYFSIGMHQFDLPDVEVSGIDEDIAGEWLHRFCGYLVLENPVFANGHTFSPDPDSPRQALERWPDSRHDAADGRQNPYGLWRVLPPGVEGLEVLGVEPIIMPPLMVTLAIAERDAGRPLTESEVVELVDNAPAITVELANIQQMERSRGLADINPRRAWEQWQVVRTGVL